MMKFFIRSVISHLPDPLWYSHRLSKLLRGITQMECMSTPITLVIFAVVTSYAIAQNTPQIQACFEPNIPCSRSEWRTVPALCCPGKTSYIACTVDGVWV